MKGLLSFFEELLSEDSLIIPVRLHWQRNFKRCHNQSSPLVYKLSELVNFDFSAVAQQRRTHRKMLKNVTAEERSCILVSAIEVSHKTQKI